MQNARIVVIGNCTLDLAFNLPRFPKPGESLLASGASQDVGGKGANQAVAAARSGVDVTFCSATGRDAQGAEIRNRLDGEGVRSNHVEEVDARTDMSIIHVTPGGQNSIVSTHAAAASMEFAMIRPALRDATAGDILLMQGNLSRDLTRACMREARRRGMTTVLNPAPIHCELDDLWPLVDCAVPNEVEVERLTNRPEPAAGAHRLLALGRGPGDHHAWRRRRPAGAGGRHRIVRRRNRRCRGHHWRGATCSAECLPQVWAAVSTPRRPFAWLYVPPRFPSRVRVRSEPFRVARR